MARNKDYKKYLEKATQDMEKTKQQLEAALRETLLNALCHSQYNYGVPIQISVGSDTKGYWKINQ